jgi:hypothetical protein
MPLIACKDRRVARLFRRSLLGLFLLFLFGPSRTALHAQTISIKLVDGRNARPMADKCINVWVGDKSAPKSRPLLDTKRTRMASPTFTSPGRMQRLAIRANS